MPDETPQPDDQPTSLNWETAPGDFRKAHDELRAERGQLERELAMHRAGVDTEHPFFSYFDKGYAGKLVPEDIKSEWAKLTGSQEQPGTPSETPPANDDGTPPELEQAMRDLQEQRRKLSGQGVVPGEEPSPDPESEMLKVYQERRKAGDNVVTAQRHALQGLFDAAVAGDKRVAYASAAEQMDAWRRRHGE